VRVDWIIARDPELKDRVGGGWITTGPERDFTVKIDASRLQSGRSYFYAFEALGQRSPVGTTKTLSVGPIDVARLAFVSCSNYPFGYFNGYAALAQRSDLDVVLHLGDYLYEYANGVYGDGTEIGRVPRPDRELVSLSDYRLRHAQYKTDPDLQALHARHPVIAIWDDHEHANDAWHGGAQNHQEDIEGDWSMRRAASVRAYLEWLPIRESFHGDAARIFRAFRFGDLVDLFMLDARLYGRDQQADPRDTAAQHAEGRRLLGAEQRAWLDFGLRASKAANTHWRILGQQVLMGQLTPQSGMPPHADAWQGYPRSRSRLLQLLRSEGIDNTIVLTGDIHSSWALELSEDPFSPAHYDSQTSEGALAVELVTPAITSPAPGDPSRARERCDLILTTQPHIKWVDLQHRGFAVLELMRERAIASWYFVPTIERRDPTAILSKQLQVLAGRPRLEEINRGSAQ
jgi:alkaline phosphatase D